MAPSWSDCNRGDLALGRLIQHKALTGWRDAQDQAAGLGSNDQVVLCVDGERARVRFLGLEEHRTRARRT